jgi:hypothetical protein
MDNAFWHGPRQASGPLLLAVCIVALIAPLALGAHAPGAPEQPAPPAETGPATSFPLGVFEDANIINGDPSAFRAMITDLRAHGFDAVLFNGGSVARDAPLLTIADQLGFDVYFTPAYDLDRQWWPASVPADIATARRVIGPLVEQLRAHPSVKGYNLADEPGLAQIGKVALALRVFREYDPGRPAMPVLIGIDRVGPYLAAARPDVLLIDLYPVGAQNPPCDFTLTGYGYRYHDFVSYARQVTRDRPPDMPLWMILQTHGVAGWLRAPTPTEVRMQQWLAIGEGATGLFWFIYSSQQGWLGLKDSPQLYGEASTLARRLAPLRPVLGDLQRVPDRFRIAGGGAPYASTLVSPDGTRTFVVAVNRDCRQAQALTLAPAADAFTPQGMLRDLETGQLFALGAPIDFLPGDGRLFELVDRASCAGER